MAQTRGSDYVIWCVAVLLYVFDAARLLAPRELLLVEDDSMVGLTAAATLRSFGYEVVHAADGHAAIERVRAEPGRFGLVILDLRMPGLSGEATFDALRALTPTLKILIWSGYVAEHDVSAILQRGAVGFVQKPYRVADLSRVVAEALGA